MRVDFSLPEQNLPDLFIGQTLHLSSDEAGQSFEGQISGIDPRVDPSSRLVAVRGTVDGAGGALTPGQFVRLRLDLPVEEGVIALPQTAVISSLYGDFVYVVRPREGSGEGGAEALEVRQVFVTPGRRSEGQIEIRDGVAAGDRIVTTGQNRLSNGAPVTLAEAAAAPAGDASAAADEVAK
ncbi:MAG: efflux RND transporter periplasmic adaptor subunit, partial [Paracoccaceae bacterium]|jgi:membrane fusion protein (multidrug efflux system)|nr:efflux RND transporter periplasmic adaptor subunit [Paracoccaceae bacterium]